MIAASSVTLLYILCNIYIAVANERIIGGKPTVITEVPYQLSLESRYYVVNGVRYVHICGAVIIDKQWALTAAHCVMGEDHLRIRAGASRLGKGDVYDIDSIIMHPDHNYNIDDYDVAVLKMEKPFRFSSYVQPIPLATKVPPIGTRATVSGWGHTKQDQLSSTLQKVDLEILSSESCLIALKENLTERMLCAGFMRKGQGNCKGDSGGPLVSGGKLIGIVTGGYPCSLGGGPGVYANVANLSGWIKQVQE